MVYCKECGNALSEGSKFCSNCGSKIELKTDYLLDSYKNKKPICGLIGLWLMVGIVVIIFLIGVIVSASKTNYKISSSVIPVIGYFLLLASVILAIVSLARGEKKAPGIITISVLGGMFIIGLILSVVLKL